MKSTKKDEIVNQAKANDERHQAIHQRYGVALDGLSMIGARVELLIEYYLGEFEADNLRRLRFEEDHQQRAKEALDGLETWAQKNASPLAVNRLRNPGTPTPPGGLFVPRQG